MTRTIIIAVLSLCVLLCSCGGGRTAPAAAGDTVSMCHASHISIVKHEGYTLVRLADPWNAGRTLHTYVLVPADGEIPDNIPEGTLVRTPLRRTVIATSVHCSLAMSMGCGDCIAGVCDLQYINLPWIKERCGKGLVADCGSSMSPTVEKIIELKPDAIFLSPFQNSGGYGRVSELGVPVIEVADYMETGPLARAEWMKFYGMLFGAEHEADSIYNKVEQNYNHLKTIAAKSPRKRSVLMDTQTGSVWYVPGGQSTIGRIIADANAGYAWADDNSNGSLALPFESVLGRGGQADVWIFRYSGDMPATADWLLSQNKGYAQLKAFRAGEMYGCNTTACTFYEDTPFCPDLLLRDFIIITHPDIKGLGEPEYFKKVKE